MPYADKTVFILRRGPRFFDKILLGVAETSFTKKIYAS